MSQHRLFDFDALSANERYATTPDCFDLSPISVEQWRGGDREPVRE